jgi:hypothetical protein
VLTIYSAYKEQILASIIDPFERFDLFETELMEEMIMNSSLCKNEKVIIITA